MIIYKGYYYFNQGNGGWITQLGLRKRRSGALVSMRGEEYPISFDIQVNKKDPLEEKIKTVLHELAHLGRDYEQIVNPKQISLIEPFIDEMITERIALEFYNRNPPLVRKLRQNLKQHSSFKLSSQ